MTLQSTDLFAVHRSGTTYQAQASVVKSGILNSHIIQSPTPPTVGTHPGMTDDTIWVDTSQSPPVINVWDPAANGGTGGWEEVSGGAAKPINPAPGGTSATPGFVSGTGTQNDPFIITPTTVAAAASTVQSAQTITFSGLKDGALVVWTDNSVGAGTRFWQPNGVVSGTSWSGKLSYTDIPASTADRVFTGDLKIGTVYFRWVVTQQVSVAPDVGTVTLADVAGGARFTSTAFPVSATMLVDGVPKSDKKLKAYVEGALKSAALTSGIANVATSGTVQPAATWSASTLLSGSYLNASTGLDKIFDGLISTVAAPAIGGNFYAQLTNPINTGGKKVYLYLNTQAVSDPTATKVQVNDSGWVDPLTLPDDGTTGNSRLYEITSLIGGSNTLSKIGFSRTGNQGGIYFLQIGSSKVIDGSPNDLSSTVLTLTDNTQLANFAAGDAVTEVAAGGAAGDATGTVGSVNATAKTITLSATSGTWDVGSQVKGPLKTVTKKPESDEIVQVQALAYSGNALAGQAVDTDYTAYLTGLGVTAITGLRLQANTDAASGVPDSAALYYFKVGGNFVNYPPAGMVIVQDTSRSAQHTWQAAFNSVSGEYAQDDNGRYMEIHFDPIAIASGFVINARDYNDAKNHVILVRSQVGAWIPLNYGSSQTQLTLRTDKDLRDFASGDAVQQDSGSAPTSDAISAYKSVTTTPINYTVTGPFPPYSPGPGQYHHGHGQNSTNGVPDAESELSYAFTGVTVGDALAIQLNYFGQFLKEIRITGDIDKPIVFPHPSPGTTLASAYPVVVFPTATSGSIKFKLIAVEGPQASYTPGAFNTHIQADIQDAGPAVTLQEIDFATSANLAAFGPGMTVSQDDNAVTGVLNAVDVARSRVVLASTTGAWSVGKKMVGPSVTASGTVASADPTAKTITLSSSTGSWAANAGKWVIGPTKASSSVKLYCKLNAAGAVSDLQSADPGFTAWTPAGTGPYTGNITFPATLPSGQPPDSDLPPGTQLTVEVQATNTTGTDSAASNTITPG